jgi:nitrite reductase/ring-hydroxylating ferredoxin subunit
MSSVTAGDDGLFHVGSVNEFVLNRFRVLDTPAGSVGVVRTSEGFHAVLNRCPHMGAPICVGFDLTSSTVPSRPFEYQIGHQDRVVRCPWHRWEFSIDTGQSIGNTNKGRLLRFPVIIEGRDVYIRYRNARVPSIANNEEAIS